MKLFTPILVFIVCSVHFGATAPALASDPCHRLNSGPRLDLTSPFGCTYSEYFSRQIDEPSDRSKPRKDGSADTGRRLKTLSDWRKATWTSMSSDSSSSSGSKPDGENKK